MSHANVLVPTGGGIGGSGRCCEGRRWVIRDPLVGGADERFGEDRGSSGSVGGVSLRGSRQPSVPHFDASLMAAGWWVSRCRSRSKTRKGTKDAFGLPRAFARQCNPPLPPFCVHPPSLLHAPWQPSALPSVGLNGVLTQLQLHSPLLACLHSHSYLYPQPDTNADSCSAQAPDLGRPPKSQPSPPRRQGSPVAANRAMSSEADGQAVSCPTPSKAKGKGEGW